jgi:hypothetical protein
LEEISKIETNFENGTNFKNGTIFELEHISRLE